MAPYSNAREQMAESSYEIKSWAIVPRDQVHDLSNVFLGADHPYRYVWPSTFSPNAKWIDNAWVHLEPLDSGPLGPIYRRVLCMAVHPGWLQQLCNLVHLRLHLGERRVEEASVEECNAIQVECDGSNLDCVHLQKALQFILPIEIRGQH